MPHIREFNRALNIDEAAFMQATEATFKLGIEFCDWGRVGDSYLHPFGDFGAPLGDSPFHHQWLRLLCSDKSGGDGPGDLGEYSLPIVAARECRFSHPPADPAQPALSFGYAYQFDSALYGRPVRVVNEAGQEQPQALRIAVCGSGLAAAMANAALAAQLPPETQLVHVGEDTLDTDAWYGGMTGAGAYDFNLAANVTEPDVFLQTDTVFSFGTLYADWGEDGRSWIQALHLALPITEGVEFAHLLRRAQGADLEPFLISAVAGREGRFAHPPDTGASPLSRAEYGYQFDPERYAALFRAAAGRVERVRGIIADVRVADGRILAIRMADGALVTADLFVDCTGPSAMLLTSLGAQDLDGRSLHAAWSAKPSRSPGAPLRAVQGRPFGWLAETQLAGQVARITIADPSAQDAALAAHDAPIRGSSSLQLGWRDDAWRGNCVAPGHAAGVLEPLTAAPMMLLERGISRLLSLVPVSRDMQIEAREFNRLHRSDHRYAAQFTRTLYAIDNPPETAFWRSACGEPMDEDLARRLALFRSRGTQVRYDLEPFHPEDWTILHFGMGRLPERHDPLAEAVPLPRAREMLGAMSRTVAGCAQAMPAHARYLEGLRGFLRQQAR